MSFLSVLKKIGQKVIGADEQIKEYTPIAQMFTSLIPGDKDDKIVNAALLAANDGLVRFQKIILDVEVIGQEMQLQGSVKAAMAAPAIVQLFMDLPIIKGRKPKDPEVTKADAAALGGALAKFLNGWEG